MIGVQTSAESSAVSELFSALITPMACSLAGETQEITIRQNSLAQSIYQEESVIEKFNCSYSLNEDYRATFEQSDLQIAGVNADGDVRVIEIANHRFYLATLFQPQLNTDDSPHPVIISFLKEAGK